MPSPNPQNQRDYMQRLTARPHHVGSPYDKDNAEWMLAKFKEWGLDANIESFDVLFPTPKARVVELLEPTKFTAKLQEPVLPIDPTSNQQAEQLPTYNAYSGDGDVTAPLVYVNYGIPDDYEKLERLGVSVKGAIVIARYGNSWRGIKPKVAAEHGAVGCLIYSDPADDGYVQGDAFPNGAMAPARRRAARQRDGYARLSRRSTHARRRSHQGCQASRAQGRQDHHQNSCLADFLRRRTTPAGRVEGRRRSRGLARFPAQTYHLGPGPAKVHLKVQSNWDIKPLYDVIVKIPGSTAPDEWVVRGNHHDAWVNGAEDPISGAVALMEEARGLATLLKQGWKPKRTIIYCVWDGEEPALLGSTEWGEAHADELRQHAVAYINSDGNGRGYLSMGGFAHAGEIRQRRRQGR